MKIDVNKLSRIYETKYNLLLQEIKDEKVSFYLLNDILIFICLQNIYNESEEKITFEQYKLLMNKYEKNLSTNIFFDSYGNMEINENVFQNAYRQPFCWKEKMQL